MSSTNCIPKFSCDKTKDTCKTNRSEKIKYVEHSAYPSLEITSSRVALVIQASSHLNHYKVMMLL